MRVLVTGSGGFVGHAVVRALEAAGHVVRRAARHDPVDEHSVPMDLGDPRSVERAVAGMDAICHTAALTRTRESREYPGRYWRTNAVGTLVLLESAVAEASRRHVVPAIVLLSTAAVYADTDAPITEATPTEPRTPYGASKLAADMVARDLASTGVVGAISLRPMNVAGAVAGRGDGDMTRVIPQVVADRPHLSVNGDGTAVRDYVHVADVADAAVRAVEACVPGSWRAFNLGTGLGSSVLDIVRTAECATGEEVVLDWRPAVGEAPTIVTDSSRARTELGWTASRSHLGTIVHDAWQARVHADRA